MNAVVIDPLGDFRLRVRVIEIVHNDYGRHISEIDSLTLQVSKGILMQTCEKFKTMVNVNGKSNTTVASYDMTVESRVSVEIWLRALCGHIPTTRAELKDVWHVIDLCHNYRCDIGLLKGWFSRWYQEQPVKSWFSNWRPWKPIKELDLNKDPRRLLFPCWQFNNAEAFLEVTKHLVYNCSGQIAEIAPIDRHHLHMDSRVSQQLNAARGRLKTILFNPLYAPIDDMVQTKRDCCDRVTCDYLRALSKTKAWPLEAMGNRHAMNELLGWLTGFRYEVTGNSCVTCQMDYNEHVHRAIRFTANYFDGLCLDCMDTSQAKTGSTDNDYWMHNFLEEEDFMYGCRVKEHKQPTWYYSFMGRKEEQDRMRKERFEGRVGRHGHGRKGGTDRSQPHIRNTHGIAPTLPSWLVHAAAETNAENGGADEKKSSEGTHNVDPISPSSRTELAPLPRAYEKALNRQKLSDRFQGPKQTLASSGKSASKHSNYGNIGRYRVMKNESKKRGHRGNAYFAKRAVQAQMGNQVRQDSARARRGYMY